MWEFCEVVVRSEVLGKGAEATYYLVCLVDEIVQHTRRDGVILPKRIFVVLDEERAYNRCNVCHGGSIVSRSGLF